MMYGQGGLGTSFKTARAHDADFGVLENHQNQFLERLWNGVREGPREKRRSDDVRAEGVASPCRVKAPDTGYALDHGGRAGL